MTTLEDRIEALERRVRRLIDELEIGRLIAAYGPAVDSLQGDVAADIWTADGTYETAGRIFSGRDELAGIVDFGPHPGLVASGCAHVNSAPVIVVDGDVAAARTYSRVYRRAGGAWVVERLSANAWTLVREAGGWRVRSRINRLLDGDEAARDLLRAPVQPADLAPSASSTVPET